jgi:hypothetical protein
MWLFTKHGFFSVVCARHGDGTQGQPIDTARLMVRARVRGHLEALKERCPDHLGLSEISTFAGTDYAFRMFVDTQVWSRVLSELALETDYDNFKRQVTRHQGAAGVPYEQALHDVWAVMYRLQEKVSFIDRCMEAGTQCMPEQDPESQPFYRLFRERPPHLKDPSLLAPEERDEYLRWLGTFEALFTPAPDRWGYRGDQFLWIDLTAGLAKQRLPDSVSDLLKMIGKNFRELTGQKLLNEGELTSDRYSYGGMSSGMVDMSYWRGPLWRELVSRFFHILELRQVSMKVVEKDLDLLLEHALWAGADFRRWFLGACGVPADDWRCDWSRADHVWTSVVDEQGTRLEGETDVLVVLENENHERLALHIENKQPGRRFNGGQAAQYSLRAAKLANNKKYGRYTSWRTVLVAPKQLCEDEPSEAARFDVVVDYHELADRLGVLRTAQP